MALQVFKISLSFRGWRTVKLGTQVLPEVGNWTEAFFTTCFVADFR